MNLCFKSSFAVGLLKKKKNTAFESVKMTHYKKVKKSRPDLMQTSTYKDIQCLQIRFLPHILEKWNYVYSYVETKW